MNNNNNDDKALDLLLEERFRKLKANNSNNNNVNNVSDSVLEDRAKSLGLYIHKNEPLELHHTQDEEDMLDEILNNVRDELRIEGHNTKAIPLSVNDNYNDDDEEEINANLLKDLVDTKSLKNDYKKLKKELKNEKIKLKELKPDDISKMKDDLEEEDDNVENEDALADALIAKLMAED